MMVSSTSTRTCPVSAVSRLGPRPAQQRRLVRERGQEPRGHRVELADVTEGERPQERPQRRGCVAAGEDPAHPTVPQQRHVVDGVGAGDHPRDQRGHLQPRVRALVGRHRQVLLCQRCEPGRLRQRHHRDQPRRRHQIRVVEHRRRRSETCEKVAPVGCPSCFVEWNRREVPFFKPARASVRYGTLNRPDGRRSSVDPGLVPSSA